MSGGVGAAATAYGKTKVRTYSDLDMSKYTFIPFIVETTGGMSKAAHGFCKELRKRRERLTFNLQPEDEKSITISDPLLIAINIELQRLNSRMVLERAPHSDNLIDADIVKCQRSIAIKRKEAIESLWLETLKPDRIIEKEKDPKAPSKHSRARSSKKISAREKKDPLSKQKQSTRCLIKSPKVSIRSACGRRVEKMQVKWQNPQAIPLATR